MKSRLILVASSLLLLLAAGVFAMGLRKDAAASRDINKTSPPIVQDVISTIDPASRPAQEAADPAAGKTPEETASLISGWVDSLLSQRGWLHIKELVNQEGMDLGNLPDSTAIPEDYLFESWYFVGDSGLVTAAVSKMYDLEGGEVQVTIFEDEIWTNLTFGFTEPGEYFRPTVDHGVARIVTSTGRASDGSGLQIDEAFRAERAVLEITRLNDDFDAPLVLSGIPGEVEAIISRSVFDAESGEAISFEKILRSPDGTERLVSSVLMQVIERIDAPPSDILSLFKEVPE